MAGNRDNKINGALFDNNKKEKKNQPDFWGSFTVTEDFARELYARARNGKNGEVRINLSAWWKQPKDKNSKVDRFISMSADFGADKENTNGRGRSADEIRGNRDRDSRDPPRRDDRDPPRRDDRDERGRQGRGEFDDEIPF